MILPLLLIAIAILASGVMTYGTHPNWAQFQHGLDLILWTRRLQWPLVTLSLLCCLGLILTVVLGKRRAWWLIGLGPVLALFVHKFMWNEDTAFQVVDNPQIVQAVDAKFLADDDFVVGISYTDESYAYPFAALYRTPVVIQSNHGNRFILLWSPFANRARAYAIGRDLKSRDLEIVSMPVNSLLVYNDRLGEFIVGITGRTTTGQKPHGLGMPIVTEKVTWKAWRLSHPSTWVMQTDAKFPPAPVRPYYPMPAMPGAEPADEPVVLLPTTRPTAVTSDSVVPGPVNVMAGDVPVLLVRDRLGRMRAFDRRLAGDLVPSFKPVRNPRFPKAVMTDADSNSLWTIDGVAIDGPLKGQQLKGMECEDTVYWGVIKRWLPELTRQSPPPTTMPAEVPSENPRTPGRTRTPRGR